MPLCEDCDVWSAASPRGGISATPRSCFRFCFRSCHNHRLAHWLEARPQQVQKGYRAQTGQMLEFCACTNCPTRSHQEFEPATIPRHRLAAIWKPELKDWTSSFGRIQRKGEHCLPHSFITSRYLTSFGDWSAKSVPSLMVYIRPRRCHPPFCNEQFSGQSLPRLPWFSSSVPGSTYQAMQEPSSKPAAQRPQQRRTRFRGFVWRWQMPNRHSERCEPNSM